MPRLTDFDPQWIDTPTRKGIGFTFRCVTGHCRMRMAVLFANPLDGGPAFDGDSWKLKELVGEDVFERGCGLTRWNRTGDTFATLTCSPSIDARECGHFTVQNGAW